MKKILLFILFLPFLGGVVASLLNFNKQEIYKFQKIMTSCIYIYIAICFMIIIYEVYRIVKIELLIKKYPKKLDLYFAENFKEVINELKKDKKEATQELIYYIIFTIFFTYLTIN